MDSNDSSPASSHKVTTDLNVDVLRQELIELQFIDILRKIHSLIKEGPSCFVSYARGIPGHEKLVHKLAIQLKEAGIKVSLDIWDNKAGSARAKFTEKISTSDYIILVGSKQLMKKYHSEGRGYHINLEIDLIIEKLRVKPGSVIPIILDGGKNSSLPAALGTIRHIDFKDLKNYYSHVFELLGSLLHDYDLSNFIKEFTTLKDHTEKRSLEELVKAEKEFDEKGKILTAQVVHNKIEGVKGQLGKNHTNREAFHTSSNIQEEISKSIIKFTQQRKKQLAFSLSFLSILIGISIFFQSKQDLQIKLNNKNPHKQIICSNLMIPRESAFLKRAHIIEGMEYKLKGNQKIPTIPLVAIVGMGGAGKTTLARYYAKIHPSSVVWELNAETKISLMNSFKDLAYELAQTKEQKEELSFIHQIKDLKEKEKKLFIFIKNRLRDYPNWLLIYDNVETFSDIKTYFPNDLNVWGVGKVILTTRNSNIKNTIYIEYENIIQVEELTREETLELFSKILYGINSEQLQREQKEKISDFLINIPPFPLDVSVAAYYIKDNHTSFKQYLEMVNQCSQDFEKVQENLIQEISDYKKTRYGIITLSIEKLINTNPFFKKLLFFISILNSQHIPKNLLELYESSPVVDSFIHALKKYSLITNTNEDPSKQGKIQTFSLHRSTQAIILSYSTQILQLDSKQLQSIINTLAQYTADAREQNNYEKMKIMIRHYDRVLMCLFIMENARSIIRKELGGIYYELGYYSYSQKLLEENLICFKTEKEKNYFTFAQSLIYLGAVYREQGKYEQSRVLLEKGLQIYKIYFPQEELKIAWALVLLGNTFKDLGGYTKSKALLEESLKIYKKNNLEEHPKFALILEDIGVIYWNLGDYKKAKKLLETSLEIYKKNFFDDHIHVAWASRDLGRVVRELGEYQKAKNLLEESLKIHKKYYPEDNYKIAWNLIHLGAVYTDLGNYKKAKELLETSLAIYKKNFSDDHINVAWALRELGRLMKKLGEYENARVLFENILIIFKNHYGKNHIQTGIVINELGKVYLFQEDIKKAESLFNQALDIFKSNKHPNSYKSLEGLADLYFKKAKQSRENKGVQEAKELKAKSNNSLKEALKIVEKEFPTDFPHLKTLRSKLLQFNAEMG
jgi:tetratricopeptide (TPR) repeat protein/GTPase SAR1 family protein